MTARVLGKPGLHLPGGGRRTTERIVALLCDSLGCDKALQFPIKPEFTGTDQQAIIEANAQVVAGLARGWRIDMSKHYCSGHK